MTLSSVSVIAQRAAAAAGRAVTRIGAFARPIALVGTFVATLSLAGPAAAQSGQQEPQHQHPAPAEQVDHTQHMAAAGLFPSRDASGTAWLPEASPMYGLHSRAGAWELMWHGSAFLQFLHEEAEEHRGA